MTDSRRTRRFAKKHVAMMGLVCLPAPMVLLLLMLLSLTIEISLSNGAVRYAVRPFGVRLIAFPSTLGGQPPIIDRRSHGNDWRVCWSGILGPAASTCANIRINYLFARQTPYTLGITEQDREALYDLLEELMRRHPGGAADWEENGEGDREVLQIWYAVDGGTASPEDKRIYLQVRSGNIKIKPTAAAP